MSYNGSPGNSDSESDGVNSPHMNIAHTERTIHTEISARREEEAVQSGLDYVREHYDHAKDPRARLEYHNTEHTQDVIDRIQKLLEILSPHDVALGRIAAAWHDAVQHWTMTFKVVEGNRVVGKKRMTKFNERASAHMLIAHMKFINDKEGPTFTDEDMAIVTEAILATTPYFDSELGTVSQPFFTPDVHIVAKALALADLGGGAMYGGAYFIEEGNRNFREMNGDITEFVQRGVDFNVFSPGYREALRARMLADAAGQVRFAQGRLALLPNELALLPEEHREAVATLMNKLPEAIEAAQATLERRSQMSLEELIGDVYGRR